MEFSVPRDGPQASSVQCIGGSAHEGRGGKKSTHLHFVTASPHSFLMGTEASRSRTPGHLRLESGRICVGLVDQDACSDCDLYTSS